MELATGISGIFINPYKRAQTEGVEGFFKGVGTGLLGALISPFSAVLKVTNSLAVGLRNTATFFSRGKVKTDRFRHPRHIIPNEGLRPYDPDSAEVQAILRQLGDFANNKLIFFADFKYIEPGLTDLSTLILTDKKLLIVYQGKENLFELKLSDIKNTEVHINPEGSNYLLLIYTSLGDRQLIVTDNLEMCCQLHGILQKLIHH